MRSFRRDPGRGKIAPPDVAVDLQETGQRLMRCEERQITAIIYEAQDQLKNDKKQERQRRQYQTENSFKPMTAVVLQGTKMRLHQPALQPELFGNFLLGG
ncbi:MAG: hypothetical protein ALAOOOJD_04431 [bacterium]|nr:hypothetical protein [bacterium]